MSGKPPPYTPRAQRYPGRYPTGETPRPRPRNIDHLLNTPDMSGAAGSSRDGKKPAGPPATPPPNPKPEGEDPSPPPSDKGDSGPPPPPPSDPGNGGRGGGDGRPRRTNNE